MRLTAVNIGKSEPFDAKDGATAINKKPQAGPVQITRLGPVGDTIVDTDNHGGPDQAVYVMGQGDYDYWSAELGRDLPPGVFGENLLIEGLSSDTICVGDRLQIGDAILEATAPRIPCAVLARWMDDKTLPKRFMKASHPGFYTRVIAEGQVAAEDAVTLTPFETARIGIVELMHWYAAGRDKAAGQRFLAAPLHYKMRDELTD